MDRALVNTQITLQVQFQVDGVGTDPAPDTATVTVTRADGTVLVNNQNATGGTDGVFTYTLPAAQNTLLDTLTARWTSALGTLTTRTEIVGGFLFTIAELRALNPQLADSNQYPVSEIVAMRTTVEEAIEQYTGALVPRYATETLSGSNIPGSGYRCRSDAGLRLSNSYVRSIRSIAVDGAALSGGDLANVTVDGSFLYGYGWPRGWSNIVVGYEHGRDRPPERLRRAALLLAKIWLVSGPVDDRTNTFTSTEGGTFSLVTPGRGGSIFGIPEVDAAVMGERIPVIA